MKIKTLIFLFVSLSFTSCGIPSRVRTASIIDDAQEFRDAEQIYKDKYGNGSYATVKELIDKGLLETRFADLEEHGYRFNLKVEKERYNLLIVPEAEINKSQSGEDWDEELSLFVDESGVIRASVKPNSPATSKSSPISPK
jgi:hypothetical protein